MTEDLRSALIALSSASAILWTGALIVTQLADQTKATKPTNAATAPWKYIQLGFPPRPPANKLRTREEVLTYAALALLGTAIFGPIFAIFSHGSALAIIALIFFLSYSKSTLGDISFAFATYRHPERIRDDVSDKSEYQKVIYWYVGMEAFQLISMAVIAIHPDATIVFLIAAFSLFAGYQAVLARYAFARRPFDPNE